VVVAVVVENIKYKIGWIIIVIIKNPSKSIHRHESHSCLCILIHMPFKNGTNYTNN
jgi:hypothetical protein